MDQKLDGESAVPAVKMGADRGSLSAPRQMIGFIWASTVSTPLTYFSHITTGSRVTAQARGTSILKAGLRSPGPGPCISVALSARAWRVISDWLMRRTGSLNIARKTPSVARHAAVDGDGVL